MATKIEKMVIDRDAVAAEGEEAVVAKASPLNKVKVAEAIEKNAQAGLHAPPATSMTI